MSKDCKLQWGKKQLPLSPSFSVSKELLTMQKNSMNNVAGSPLQIASKMGFCQGNLDLKCQFGIFVNL